MREKPHRVLLLKRRKRACAMERAYLLHEDATIEMKTRQTLRPHSRDPETLFIKPSSGKFFFPKLGRSR